MSWPGCGHESGSDEVMLITEMGQAIRFEENDARAMGRPAAGVIGIRMDDKDRVIAFEVLDPNTDVLTVAANGLGKRTAISLFPLQGRGGKGVVAMKLNNKTGNIVGAGVTRADDTVILVSSGGILIRIPASQISKIGRGTQGVTLMRLGSKERVATMAIIPAKDPLETEVGDMDQATNGHAPTEEVKVMVKAPGM